MISPVGLLVYSLVMLTSCKKTNFELKEIKELKANYEVVINDPILRNDANIKEHYDKTHLIMRSATGERFRCEIPQESSIVNKSDGQMIMQARELLNTLKGSKCLITTFGWWIYEFCYGKSIKKYHEINGLKGKDVIILGKYNSSGHLESQFSHPYDTLKPKDSKSSKKLYYQYGHYGNGTICEQTGNKRQSIVRFTCDKENAPDKIIEVHEYEPCKYILTISTTKLCSVPEFLGLEQQIINCNPLIEKNKYGGSISVPTDQAKMNVNRITETMNLDMPSINIDSNHVQNDDEPDSNYLEMLLSKSNLKMLNDQIQAIENKESDPALHQNQKTPLKASTLDDLKAKILSEKDKYRKEAEKKDDAEKYYFEFRLTVPDSIMYSVSDGDLNKIFKNLKNLNLHHYVDENKEE